MQQSRFDAMSEAVRNRGVFIPVTVPQDLATLGMATLLTAVMYFSLTRTRSTSTLLNSLLAFMILRP